MLTPEELQGRNRKRMRLAVLLALLLALGVGAYFTARPARDAIKGWQARRHAQKAFAFIEEQKWKEAKDSAVAGYQLRPIEPQALRAVARLLSRTGQPQALEFWDQLRKKQPLAREDLRDEAAIALSAGEMTRAQEAVAHLVGDGAAPRDWILGAQVALQRGARDDALPFIQKALEAPNATEREQLQAAILQLASAAGGPAEERREAAWSRIEKLATGSSAVALDALLVFAQQALAPAGSRESEPVPRIAPTELARMIEQHPVAKAPQKLLALDLLAAADPTQRDPSIERGVAEWKDADVHSIATLAKWLNGKGEYQRTLETIPTEKALQSADLFLQHMDALGALDRWEEIKKLLESDRYPLDPVMQRMYLARTNAQLGEKVAAENNWQRALGETRDQPQKLAMLADYAEKNGAFEVAGITFERAATAAPKVRGIQAGRLRAAQRSGNAHQIHGVLASMLELWPNDAAIRNDEAYLRLLLTPADQQSAVGTEVEQTAAALVEANPASLPHRTLLALARLKQGRAWDALQVYSQIQIAENALSASALAVHATILHANGQIEAAQSEAAQINAQQLLPEERELIAQLRD